MFFLGDSPQIVRKITGRPGEIFLTFDDGPSDFTARVLDALNDAGARAAFFVIGTEARRRPDILRRALKEGHAVLSHSMEHSYTHYFRNRAHLRGWIQDSLKELSDLSGVEQNIFRPPAGVITPPLIQAARDLNVPLILWNHRFYDTAFAWTSRKANRSLAKTQSGDIVLLHDRQKPEWRDSFTHTLKTYLNMANEKGLRTTALSNGIALQEVACAAQL